MKNQNAWVLAIAILGVMPVAAHIAPAPGTALGFNGTNQYVQVAANAALETPAATVEAWVRPQWVSNAPSQLPCITGMSKTGASRYDIYINKNYSGVTVWNGAANLSYTYAFAQNQLYHIALVFGSTTSSLFVNGVLAATVTGTLNTGATAVPLYIGSSDGTKEYFNGVIDEVRIWNVARTSQQLREAMHLVLTGAEAGLVAYYQFNEASGTTTADAKSSLTGTLVNAPTRVASSFPFGSGAVNTQTEAVGLVTFTGTNATANYTAQNGASITTTEITSPVQAYGPPSGAGISSVPGNQYWIVNRYGSGGFSATLNFKTSEDLTAADAASPGVLQLYQRAITSDGAWTYAASANTIDDTNNIASFSAISSGLGEYIMVRGSVLKTSVSGTSLCAPSAFSVGYDATGMVFSAGNIFTAQLSDGTGSFASPTTIGTLSGISVTGTITATLTPALVTASAYRIRVISSNPAVAALQDNGAALTVTNPLENSTLSGLGTGLAAFYKLDGTADDAGTNAYNGTIAGGVTATTDRWNAASSAMSFNGTNSGIDVGNAANLRMYGAVSVSAWVNIPALPSAKMVIVTKYFNNESYQFYLDNAGRLNLLEGSTTVVQTSGSVPLNQWVLVTGTTTSGNWKLYLNGVPVGTSSNAQSFLDSGGSFQIGKDGTANRFAGSMDELRIYNRVLTAAEVLVLYNDGIASNSGPLCAGGSFTLSSLTATGSTYSWTGPNGYSSGSQNPPVIPSASTAMSGMYTLTTSRNGCTSQPQRTAVVVNPLPAAPGVTDVARCSNGTVLLTASGSTNGNYRWYTVSSGGAPVGGAVNASYTTPSLTVTTPYWVSIMSGTCEGPRAQINAVISSPIDVSLATSAATPVCSGTASSVSVSGSDAMAAYQVFRGSTAVSSVVAGGGSINLAIPAASLLSGANSLKVTATKAGCGTADLTNTVTVMVNDLPALTAQPAGQNKCAGDNVIFAVTATGTSLSYQWRKNTSNLSNGGSVAGAQTATLTLSNLAASDGGNYNCVVSGSCTPAVTSSDALLTVSSGASISQQPADDLKCPGATVSFSVTASGAGLAYQWKKGSSPLVNGGTISGAASATLSVTNLAAGDAGNYSCVVSASCGSPVTSTAAALTLYSAPALTAQPADVSDCSGENVAFSVTAGGTGLSYQWKKGTASLVNGGNISGSTTAALAITAATPGDAGSYSCVVSGTCGLTVSSNMVNLAITAPPAVTTQPSPVTKQTGESASFTIAASNAVSYQWRNGNNNLSDGTRISGAATATLTISHLVNADAGGYNCVVTNSCGTGTSGTGVLAVDKGQPVILFTTSPTTGTENTDLVISATSSSDAPILFAITGGSGQSSFSTPGTLHLIKEGTVEVTASQAATMDYLAAGALQIITILPDLVTGIEPGRLSFFPNPASKFIHLDNPGETDLVTIVDVTGRRVRQWTITKTTAELDLTELGQGMYFINAFRQGNKIAAEKIIIY